MSEAVSGVTATKLSGDTVFNLPKFSIAKFTKGHHLLLGRPRKPCGSRFYRHILYA